MTEIRLTTTPAEIINFADEIITDENYSGSADLFLDVARYMGVNVDDATVNIWRTKLRAAAGLDVISDIGGGSILPTIDRVLDGEQIPGIDESLQRRCRGYMAMQSPVRQAEILQMFGRIDELTLERPNITAVDDLIANRLEEADIFAELLWLPTEGMDDAEQREAFNSWVTGFARCAYAIDTFLDVRKDFKNRESGVHPSMRVRLALAKVAMPETVISVKKTPLRIYGKAALVAFRYFLLNKRPRFSEAQTAALANVE
ncbi:MAG TPA: hypothetical protein VLG47_02985 [Candidatus Saccharimonadales bacterium]|nr:hypothetical protein [Candidatus Saccharimonadales bacterium]